MNNNPLTQDLPDQPERKPSPQEVIKKLEKMWNAGSDLALLDCADMFSKSLEGRVVVDVKDLDKLSAGSNFSRAVETQKFLDKYRTSPTDKGSKGNVDIGSADCCVDYTDPKPEGL